MINPDGNIWMRVNFDSAYITRLISQHWSGPELLQARTISKMMQDHYRMITAATVAEFDVSIETLMDFTWFMKVNLNNL